MSSALFSVGTRGLLGISGTSPGLVSWEGVWSWGAVCSLHPAGRLSERCATAGGTAQYCRRNTGLFETGFLLF